MRMPRGQCLHVMWGIVILMDGLSDAVVPLPGCLTLTQSCSHTGRYSVYNHRMTHILNCNAF